MCLADCEDDDHDCGGGGGSGDGSDKCDLSRENVH